MAEATTPLLSAQDAASSSPAQAPPASISGSSFSGKPRGGFRLSVGSVLPIPRVHHAGNFQAAAGQRRAGGGPAARLAAHYESALVSKPVPTKMASGAVLWGLGDVVAQVGTRSAGDDAIVRDPARLGRAVAFGCVIHAPIAHTHYEFLEWLVHRVKVPPARHAVVKVVVEQFVYWGYVSNALYHFAMAKMEGQTRAPARAPAKPRSRRSSRPPWLSLPGRSSRSAGRTSCTRCWRASSSAKSLVSSEGPHTVIGPNIESSGKAGGQEKPFSTTTS